MDERKLEQIVKAVMERLLEELNAPLPADPRAVPVELSGRHVHLTKEHAQTLFGGPLTRVRDLSQPGQFLCRERVRLVGPKGVIDNVAVLGPERPESQVEVSLTDARILGVNPPVRLSGDIKGSPGVMLSGPQGMVNLDQGVIVSARHIHMTPGDAERFDVRDGERVCVQMQGDRPAIFQDVIVRVSGTFALAMHIDADEANGCGMGKNAVGIVQPVLEEA